jgi:hypothetical protein
VAVEVKIEDVRQVPALDAGRLGKRDTLVTYRIGAGRARTVLLPKDAPTAAEVQAAIRAQETASTALIGQSFPL